MGNGNGEGQKVSYTAAALRDIAQNAEPENLLHLLAKSLAYVSSSKDSSVTALAALEALVGAVFEKQAELEKTARASMSDVSVMVKSDMKAVLFNMRDGKPARNFYETHGVHYNELTESCSGAREAAWAIRTRNIIRSDSEALDWLYSFMRSMR